MVGYGLDQGSFLLGFFKSTQVQESLTKLIYDKDATVRGQAAESSVSCLGLLKTAQLVRKGPEDIAAVFIERLPYQDISSSTILLLEQFSGHQSENVRAAVVEVAAGLLEEYDGKPIFRPRLEALARPEQHSSSDSHGA